MLNLLCCFVAALAVAPGSTLQSASAAPPASVEVSEVWAYLVMGEPGAYRPDLPITDLALFSATINTKGELATLPNLSAVKSGKARRHLVLAEVSNAALTHFVLDPELPMRRKLLDDLVKAGEPYEGIQLDFEAVPAFDKVHYLSFLAELKARAPDKIISVALPARVSKTQEYFDYEEMARVCDRILIMAYDEHWANSQAGPIASPAWGARVAEYSLSRIGPEKLVMGLPFYGRIWASKNHAGAYRFTSIERILKENKAKSSRNASGILSSTFSAIVSFTTYFEDVVSLAAKARTYADKGIRRIGFWRLGLEDAAIWNVLKLAPAKEGTTMGTVVPAGTEPRDKNSGDDSTLPHPRT